MKYSVDQDRPRASIYGLLAKLFDSPPNAEMFSKLRKSGFFVPLSTSSKEPSGCDLEFDSDHLNSEYTRLFLGPGKHVSPFASVYRRDDSRSGDLWGSTTGEVKRFMKHYGISLSTPGAIPDHIAILFEFMEKVIRAKINESESSNEQNEREEAIIEATKIEKRFFNTYINSWVDEFLAEVERANPGPFYRLLMEQTRFFVLEERSHLEP